MDEEVESIEYNSSSLFEIWAIFNNELEYLEQERIDTNLLKGNSKLANSYKAMVSKTLNFIKEMRKYTKGFVIYNAVWTINLNQLKSYLNQVAKGDKSKSQVKNIAQDIFNHLNKLKDMAYATKWTQSGSKDIKNIFNKYVGSETSEYHLRRPADRSSRRVLSCLGYLQDASRSEGHRSKGISKSRLHLHHYSRGSPGH